MRNIVILEVGESEKKGKKKIYLNALKDRTRKEDSRF